MKLRRAPLSVLPFLFATALFGAVAVPSHAQAQDRLHHAQASQEFHGPSNGQDTLLETVRRATARFRDVRDAKDANYELMFGCVSGPDEGAMGLHFVNKALLDDKLEPTEPEILLYEQLPNGRLRLTGADFLVDQAAWDAANPGAPPQLMGQLFHLFEAPNRFGLKAFYTLHVWAWKANPAGAFANWHPNVSCDVFDGQPR